MYYLTFLLDPNFTWLIPFWMHTPYWRLDLYCLKDSHFVLSRSIYIYQYYLFCIIYCKINAKSGKKENQVKQGFQGI